MHPTNMAPVFTGEKTLMELVSDVTYADLQAWSA